MLKRLFKGMIAAVAAMSMTVSVMAAGSIVGSLDMGNASADKGKVIITEAVKGENATVDAINAAAATTSVKDALGSEKVGGEQIDLASYNFLTSVFNVNFEDVTPSKENPVNVTITVNNMTEGMEVYALVFTEEDGWVVVKGVVNGNQVTFPMTAPGKVAMIYKKAANESATGGTTAGGSSTEGTTSGKPAAPQTSSRTAMPAAACGVIFLAAAAFAMVQYKKENR